MKNLKILAEFIAELANAGVEYGEKKSFKILGQLFDELIALKDIEWKKLPEEVESFNLQELDETIREKLDFEDDVLETKVENIITVVLKMGELGLDLYEIFKKDE